MNNIRLLVVILIIGMTSACQQPGKNKPGSEYMPEMAHSIAYEANTYTYYPRNSFNTAEEYYAYAQPRLPVEGTVPRANAATDKEYFDYGDSEEERAKATNEIVNNPFKITEKSIENGKTLYNIYCGICHGEKGDGKGYLVRDDGGTFLAMPADFLSDQFLSASNGRFYYAMMYGKNVMAHFSDKLSRQERWEVIQYIRQLQAASTGASYNHIENTLNTTDIPGGEEEEEEVPEETKISDEAETENEESNNH